MNSGRHTHIQFNSLQAFWPVRTAPIGHEMGMWAAVSCDLAVLSSCVPLARNFHYGTPTLLSLSVGSASDDGRFGQCGTDTGRLLFVVATVLILFLCHMATCCASGVP